MKRALYKNSSTLLLITLQPWTIFICLKRRETTARIFSIYDASVIYIYIDLYSLPKSLYLYFHICDNIDNTEFGISMENPSQHFIILI